MVATGIKSGIFFLFFATLAAANVAATNLIEQITVEKNRLEIVVNEEFKQAYLLDNFFVEYDEDINLEKLDYSLVILPFIMNVISLVWISGQNYFVESLDQEVVESLDRVKKIFQVFYPKTAWTGQLIPKKIVKNEPIKPQAEGKIALLFSGGVDSTAASLAHRTKEQLLITAWGQAGLPLDQEEFWTQIKDYITCYAQEYGHTTSFIRSNYYEFLDFKKLRHLSSEIYTWRISTIEDIGWAGLTAPILIARGVPHLHIASSDTWDFPYPSACNPFIDGCISFAAIQLKHDQFNLSRFDKIASIVKLCKHHLVNKPQLIVCHKHGTINCMHCEKCLLTSLSFYALEQNPQEYGFPITFEKLQERTHTFYDIEKMSASGIWQFIDIQRKSKKIVHKQFSMDWFNELNFKGIKGYDIKEAEKVDWMVLHKMFPHIKFHHKKRRKQV